jgi:uncharacterized protein YdaU (DUF1376 family)
MKLHWMPLDVPAYRADTAHLGALEHGIYLLLIMHYWQTGGLRDDEKQLARIACVTPAEFRGARAVIEAFFAPGWKHERIERELKRAKEISASNRSKARDAASGRWSAHRLADASSNASSTSQAMLQNAQSHSPSHPQSNSPSLSSSEGKKIRMGGGEGKREGHTPPWHCAMTKAKDRIYVVKGSSEWDAYAADYREAHGVEPTANPHGGRWFRTLGEIAPTRGRT